MRILGVIYAVGFLFPKQAFRLFKAHFPLDTIQERFSLLGISFLRKAFYILHPAVDSTEK